MPNNRKRKQLEAAEQTALFEWAGLAPHPYLPGKIGDYLIAIPNGAHMANPRHAALLKAQGMKPGVSDIFLACPVQGWGGLWIELKKRREDFDYPSQAKQAVSQQQQDWIARMNQVGYIAQVAYGWEEARQRIEGYLNHGG